MKEITQALYTLLSGDTEIAGLISAQPEDPRIYFFHPGIDVAVSAVTPSYITYSMAAYGGKGLANSNRLPDEIVTFKIWGKNRELLFQIADRLDVLLLGRSLESANYSILYISREYRNDIFDKKRNLSGVEVKYRLGKIVNKNSGSFSLAVGSESITVDWDEGLPIGKLEGPRVSVLETAGGEVYATKTGENKIVREIKLTDLPETEKEVLENFYLSVCQGSLKVISFTDYDSQNYSARWINETFGFTSSVPGLWSGEIQLHITA